MAYEFILTERFDAVAVITLNRPDKLNALSFPLVRELDDALTQYEADDDIKAVILTGAGDRAFSAGADIHEMAGLSAEELADSRGGPRPRHLAHREFRQAADRRDQRARLWRGCVAELDPRSADRLRAHARFVFSRRAMAGSIRAGHCRCWSACRRRRSCSTPDGSSLPRRRSASGFSIRSFPPRACSIPASRSGR